MKRFVLFLYSLALSYATALAAHQFGVWIGFVVGAVTPLILVIFALSTKE